MSTNTKVTSKKSSGFLGGFILVIAGIMLLWFNEGRTVKTQSAINEALKSYKDVTSKKIDESNEGKLIATTGKIDLGDSSVLTDSKFKISINAAKLQRVVEIYEWEESCETDEDDNKTCTYEKVWSDKIIDSSEFTKTGYDNPSIIKLDSEVVEGTNIKVGVFSLNERLLDNLSYNKDITNQKLSEQYKEEIDGYKIDGNYLVNSEKIDDPQIGDIRVSFKYASDGEVSLLGVQSEGTLKAFTGKKGKSILILKRGSFTGRELLEDMTSSNKTIKWFLRILGTVIIISGIGSLFSPLQLLTNKVPVLSSIVNMSSNLVSFIIGLSISLIVVAIAWFRYRPVLSIILLALVVALLVFLKYKKNNTETKSKK